MAKAKMTLYSMAKQMVQNENPMDSILFNRTVCTIAEKMMQSNYWMLLCRERNDFTVFVNTSDSSKKKISKELMPTLHNRGQVLLMDEQPDGAWEIWIRDPKTQENFAYYLFDYSKAIIDCGEDNK